MLAPGSVSWSAGAMMSPHLILAQAPASPQLTAAALMTQLTRLWRPRTRLTGRCCHQREEQPEQLGDARPSQDVKNRSREYLSCDPAILRARHHINTVPSQRHKSFADCNPHSPHSDSLLSTPWPTPRGPLITSPLPSTHQSRSLLERKTLRGLKVRQVTGLSMGTTGLGSISGITSTSSSALLPVSSAQP